MQISRISLLVLITAGSFGAAWQFVSAHTEKGKLAPAWEYIVVTVDLASVGSPSREAIQSLTEAGKRGWELVAVEPPVEGKRSRIFYYKKPR